MYALCTYQVYVMILLTLSFPDGQVQEASPISKYHTRQHPYLASAELHACLMQCRYHGVTNCFNYQLGLNAFIRFVHDLTYHIFLHPLSLDNTLC